MSRKNKRNLTTERMSVEAEIMMLKSINPAAATQLRHELTDAPAAEFKAAPKQASYKQDERVGYRTSSAPKQTVRKETVTPGLTQRLQLPAELIALSGNH